ncbi:hypothetical protein BG003_010566 [Podila horticola]|nr:hypothetical protein BG003_010566 [Podila horticola]
MYLVTTLAVPGIVAYSDADPVNIKLRIVALARLKENKMKSIVYLVAAIAFLGLTVSAAPAAPAPLAAEIEKCCACEVPEGHRPFCSLACCM